MELLGIKNFAVLFFSSGVARGGRFERTEKKQWKLKRWANAELDEANPAAAWKSVLKQISSSDGLFILSGSLQDGVYFQFQSAELSAKEQSCAVELELSRRVLKLPEKPVSQFAASLPGDDLQTGVGVYLFPDSSLNSVVARMTQSSCRADNFIYPFLAVEPGDPDLYLPEVESRFYFSGGAWQPVGNAADIVGKSSAAWDKIIRKWIILPENSEDFDFNKMLPVLLIGRMVASGKYNRSRTGLSILPEKLRPVRFRAHIIIGVLLLLLLAVNGGWYFWRTWGAEYKRYNELQRENKAIKRKIDNAKRSAKKQNKELKEMERVLASGSGDPDLVAKFSLLCNALPGNVLVSSIRWNENGIDLVLQSENEKLDIPSIINPIGYWKIGQLQQRQFGDSAVATINLKLVPIGKTQVKK